MISGFKKFILRGNVVDLAIAVVIGAAFGAIVTALAKDFIGGLIGAVFSTKRFQTASFTLNGSEVIYGSTITAVLNFLIVATVIYFVVVVPMNELARRRKAGDEAAEEAAEPSEEVVLLGEIRDLLAARR